MSTLTRLHRWAVRFGAFWMAKWGERSFLVLLAILIGGLAALAAGVLHLMVEWLSRGGAALVDTMREHWYVLPVVFALPLAGIFLSFCCQRLLGGPRYAKSLSPLILALSRRRNRIPANETFTHVLSSGLSVGLGGSAGLEAPSVLTGAAIGANLGALFRIDQRRRMLLLGCGAAAAIAAIFDSPIAGVLFAAEVLLPEITVSALIPMVLSAAVAAVISRILFGDAQFFLALNAPWHTNAIPYYFLCGAVCALVGVYIIRGAYRISALLKKRCRNHWVRLATGGLMLAPLLFLFPALRGQGYGYIEQLFAGDMEQLTEQGFFGGWLPASQGALLALLTLIILLKLVASVLTVDSGGDGGIFAPSMFIGAVTGFVFARTVNLLGLIQLQEFNFVAVGMCGVFAAVMRAPLTGVFLIAEVTGSYILLVPLMIVSAVSCYIAHFFEPQSIYRKALAESDFIGRDRDQTMLRRLAVRSRIDRRYTPLPETAPLEDVIEIVGHTRAESYPVLSPEGKLLGVVYLRRILQAMLHKEDYVHLLVFDLMERPARILLPDDDLALAMKGFEEGGTDFLPVCGADGAFLGFASKTAIFAEYRQLVRDDDVF